MKAKIAIYDAGKAQNKLGGNKTWIMEIGDISELKIYSPQKGEEKKLYESRV